MPKPSHQTGLVFVMRVAANVAEQKSSHEISGVLLKEKGQSKSPYNVLDVRRHQ